MVLPPPSAHPSSPLPIPRSRLSHNASPSDGSASWEGTKVGLTHHIIRPKVPCVVGVDVSGWLPPLRANRIGQRVAKSVAAGMRMEFLETTTRIAQNYGLRRTSSVPTVQLLKRPSRMRWRFAFFPGFPPGPDRAYPGENGHANQIKST